MTDAETAPSDVNPVELRQRTYQFELYDVAKLYCMEDAAVRRVITGSFKAHRVGDQMLELIIRHQALWVAPDDDVLYISGKTKVDKFAEVLRYRIEESLQVHTHVAGAYPMDRFLKAALRIEKDKEENRLAQEKRNRRFRRTESRGVIAYMPCPIRVNADMGIMQLVAMTLPLDEIMRGEPAADRTPAQRA